MEKHTKKELLTLRNYSVIKSNDMVLKARYKLSPQEQRIILFLVSKIKKEDTELTQYTFSIQEFGDVCGIDVTGAKEYKELKESLKNLSDKSFWGIVDNSGTQSLLRWVSTVRISKRNGNISVKLHEDMMPFLLQLKGKYLDYKLHHVLAMKSMYGIRIYEMLKTRHNINAPTYKKKKENVSTIDFDLAHLKQLTETENYVQFNDFKRRVLEPAMRDINEYSDLYASYEMIKESRKFTAIRFLVRYKKTFSEGLDTMAKVENELQTRKNMDKPLSK